MSLQKRRRPRRCVGCGDESPKRGLLRVVRSPDGKVYLDLTGKAPGRGAYICPKRSCLAMAIKKKSIQRALKAEVDILVFTDLEDAVARQEGAEDGDH